jgi:succinoglycan biosynthesis transport protein ExoP
MTSDIVSQIDEESLMSRALDLLWRRRLLGSLVFTAVVASAMCFALYLPDLFRASATLLVERPVPEAYVRSAVSGELESRLHVIRQEILSRARLTELVEQFNLYPEMRHREPLDTVLDQMRHDIVVETTGPEQVSGRKNTVSFRLSYTGANGQVVADVTNALATFYVAQNDRIRSQEAIRITEFLKSQLDVTRRQLDRHEEGMRAYTTSHPGELPQQVEVNLAALERLNTQLRLNGERQMRLLEDRARHAAEIWSGPESIPAGRPVPRALAGSDRIERMKRDLQLLEGQVSARHPDLIRLKTEIAALEREQQDALVRQREEEERERAANPLPPSVPETASAPRRATSVAAFGAKAVDADAELQLQRLKEDEAALRGSIATVEKRLEGVPSRQQDLSRLTRDYQANKDLYDSLLKRFDEAQLAESLEADKQGERFRVLEPAIPPSGPVAPNRLQLLVLGVLFAVAAAGVAALIAEQFDSSFHNIEDVRRFTKVPVLATITEFAPTGFNRFARVALTTISLLVVIAGAVALSTYSAKDNARVVWLLTRGA